MYKATKKKRGEIHRNQIAEGVEKNGKRTRLIGAHYFSSTESAADAWTLVQNYLFLHYDLSNTVVISNSDGGLGYEFSQFNEIVMGRLRHEHVRDAYHVNQKIKQRLNFVPELQVELKKAIRHHDWSEIELVLTTAESTILIDEEEVETHQKEQIRLLKGYLNRNWDYLMPLYKRGLGENLRGIETCESNHRPYSCRVKGHGKYWSKDGIRNVVYVIEGLKNGTLERAILEEIPGYNKQQSDQYKEALKTAHKRVAHQPHEGVRHGSIFHISSSSSSIGRLNKMLSTV